LTAVQTIFLYFFLDSKHAIIVDSTSEEEDSIQEAIEYMEVLGFNTARRTYRLQAAIFFRLVAHSSSNLDNVCFFKFTVSTTSYYNNFERLIQ